LNLDFRIGWMIKRLFILSVVVLCYLVIRDWEKKPLVHPPGILVTEQPVQVDMEPSEFILDDYLITRRARFEINARVLSKEPYYLSREADLSPLDLALGWGAMSDQSILDQIDISQSGRWYRTKFDLPPPIPDQQIISNSSNMHMIPAREDIGRALKKLREGDIITLRGYLVDVDHDSGWHWRTSMSREDTGGGACEIVYVESLDVEI
jgi:hypothetical protein